MKIDSERSRIRGLLVNTGKYGFDEADQKLEASRLSVILAEEAAGTPAGQAAFLTAVATACRSFGDVSVYGALKYPLVIPLPLPGCVKTLGEAAIALGAVPPSAAPAARAVLIGPKVPQDGAWTVQAFWDGWIAGVCPGRQPRPISRSDCILSGIAAGALAVGQAFLAEQGDPRAGKTVQSLSLWSLDSGEVGANALGPDVYHLPEALWIIGLGNLGQAYLWSLFMLPYSDPASVSLFFQDDDLVKRDNWGTSILVERGRYEILKTRIAEEWAARRKFNVRRFDRRLDAHQRRTDQEPLLALAGLDSMKPRRLLGLPGFDYVIDAGLGATAADYQKFRINVFDSTQDPAKHFENVEDEADLVAKELLQLPAYKELEQTAGDGGCGAALLAGKSVAVPFVSAFVGALTITQAIRLASGEAPYTTATGNLGDLRSVRATPGDRPDRVTIPNSPAMRWEAKPLAQPRAV